MIKRLSRSGLLLLFIILLAAGCAASPISPPRTPSTLDPRGLASAQISQLWWVLLALGAAIWVLVMALEPRRRRRSTARFQRHGPR